MKFFTPYTVKVLLAFLFLTGSVQAQTPKIDKEFTNFEEVKDYMHTIFSKLEKNRVPYGILIDKAVSIGDVSYYDGVIPQMEQDTLDVNTLFQVTTTLATAKITDNVKVAVPPEDIEPLVERYANENNVVLGGVFYKYAKLRSDLKQGDLVMKDDILLDKYVNGVWKNPYEVKQSFVLTPIKDSYYGTEIKVKLPSDLWFSNMNDSIQKIAIDFGNGEGFKTIPLDSLIRVSYPDIGRYEWRTKLTLQDGTILLSPTFINLKVDLDKDTGCQDGSRSLGFKGITAYNGKVNKAYLEIVFGYGNSNCEMRRPLIVAEGYDPGLDKGKDGLGTNNNERFLRDINNYAGQELGSALFYYDVVYVNWLDGTDDMRRNAYLLEDIIEWVNAQKALAGSVESNVVLGQSMGGVIARYALRDMENKGKNHDTRLYISHDAPHQGANIPQGLVVAANNLAFEVPAVYFALGRMKTMRQNLKNMLNAPATKQLVKEISGNSNVYEQWQMDLRNMGYPQQTRNVAISNGSGCGQKQDITFKEQIVDGFIRLENKVQIFGTGLGKIKHGGINFEVYASPNVGGSSLGYYFRIYNKIKILWMSHTTVLYKKSVDIRSNQLPLDTYGGGLYDFDIGMDGVTYKPFNFVPTTSAFDVGKGYVTLTESDYLKSYSVSDNPPTVKQIPFQNFIASRTSDLISNTQHISFNGQIGSWLAKEIKQEPTTGDCSFVCSGGNKSIVGKSIVCQSEVYQVLIESVNYEWSIVQGNDLVDLANVNSKNVSLSTKGPDKSGLVILQVKISSPGCGSLILKKEIWVGKPKFRVEVHSRNGGLEATVHPWSNDEGSFSLQQAQVQWEGKTTNKPGVGQASFSANGLMATASGFGKYWGVSVKVTVSNQCGSVSQSFGMYGGGFKHADDEGANVLLGIMPTKNVNEYEVVGQIKDFDGNIDVLQLLPQDKVELNVYNIGGQLMKTTKEAVINLSSFPTGTYILNAVVNDQYKVELKVYKK